MRSVLTILRREDSVTACNKSYRRSTGRIIGTAIGIYEHAERLPGDKCRVHMWLDMTDLKHAIRRDWPMIELLAPQL